VVASQYRPVLIHVDPDDWPVFQEIYEKGKVSARLREMVKADINKFTREEIRAQQLAGLTES
jgi:hypothetical protein